MCHILGDFYFCWWISNITLSSNDSSVRLPVTNYVLDIDLTYRWIIPPVIIPLWLGSQCMLFHTGSFTISVLSGKIMFRDVHYVTENYSLRIQLGYAIFRWWRPLVQKEISEGKAILSWYTIYTRYIALSLQKNT